MKLAHPVHSPVRSAWPTALPVAFEGAGFAVPVSVGAIALLFAKIGPSLMAAGLLAALCGMVLIHLAAAARGRTMVYAVRVLEVSIMVGLLDQFILKMPGWGLADTPAHRMMLVMAVSVTAALFVPVFFALRLRRFARMIPAPVFAGFNTAVALTVLISQTAVLWNSRQDNGPWFAAIALLVLGGAIAATRLAPRLPPVVMGLLLGAVAAWLLVAGGQHRLGSVLAGDLSLALPVFVVPWRDFWAQDVQGAAILRDVLLAGFTLAVPMFINTVVNEETVGHLDDSQPRPDDWIWTSTASFLATLWGSPVLTPSVGASRSAVRAGRLDWRALCLVAAVTLLILGSGVLRFVPLAGVCGLLLFDAWISFDRPSLALAQQWIFSHRIARTEREDLATVGMVAFTAVFFSLATGVAMGVFLGLLLYAWRNGRRLARTVATGVSIQSNCARSRSDLARLVEHAERIRFVALEGALYFGAASDLQALLRAQFGRGRYVVIDWSHVVSADSTVASIFSQLVSEAHAAETRVAVCGLEAAGPELAETLRASGIVVDSFQDADRALEWAENGLLAEASSIGMPGDSNPGNADATSLQDSLSLFRGLSRRHREGLHELLEQRFLRAGETIFSAGDVDSALMVILQGSVDVLIPRGEGRDIRIARLRRGSMLGELGFLDKAPRTATAVATEDVILGVLTRESFDNFSSGSPSAGMDLLTNLALDLALRIRRTNAIAVNSLR